MIEEQNIKLKVACQLVAAYFSRAPDVEVKAREWEAVCVACDYIKKNLN